LLERRAQNGCQMLRFLVASAALGGLGLLTIAGTTGHLDEVPGLSAIQNPFNDVSAALAPVTQRERAWDAVTEKANAICARNQRDELVIKSALPRRHRADYVRAIGIALDRKRNIQARLVKLQPPFNYKPLYSQFLRNRKVALAELKRLHKAVMTNNRKDFAFAARALKQRKGMVDRSAEANGMPACVF
jgi:hypothetical protein